MRWSRRFLLERFLARDARYDGRFLSGVLTTGIYCRPSCSAKKPRPENVRFFASEDEARAAGLRPCLRCRPDRRETPLELEIERAEALLSEFRARPGEFTDVASLARRAGLGLTSLGRILRRHTHDSAASLLQRARVDAARRALVASSRRVLDVALDAGFESSSAFHAAFLERTGMTPSAYRALGRAREFRLGLPADFRNEDALRALDRDPASQTERRDGSRFARALALAGEPAVLEIELGRGLARCRVHGERSSSPAQMEHAHAVALRLLGLPSDPRPFERRVARSRGLRSLVRGREGLRIPQTPDAWEGLVWAVLGQQVNLAYACACRRALIERAGARTAAGLFTHPDPKAVAQLDEADLMRVGLSRRKAEVLLASAHAIEAGELDLEGLRDRSALAAERTLLARRGVGPWTAHYVLMRSFGLEDCVPVGDAGLGAALQRFFELRERPDPERTLDLMQPFAPHRSLATYHFWKSLAT